MAKGRSIRISALNVAMHKPHSPQRYMNLFRESKRLKALIELGALHGAILGSLDGPHKYRKGIKDWSAALKTTIRTGRLWGLMVCATMAISGCAVAPGPANNNQPNGVSQAIDAQRTELGNMKTSLSQRKKRLETEKLETEIAKLKKEIEDLQNQINELEERISKADAEESRRQSTRSHTAPSGKNIGPRGGCYTITKSGKKNYGGC